MSKRKVKSRSCCGGGGSAGAGLKIHPTLYEWHRFDKAMEMDPVGRMGLFITKNMPGGTK